MRASSEASLRSYTAPPLLDKATRLARYVQSLDASVLEKTMKLSPQLAYKTQQLWQSWQPTQHTLPAIDAFLGDMYSGLQAHTFTGADREYAANCLYILSGLYGVVRALDSIHPYRLEMGYKLLDAPFDNLYSYWGEDIARQLPNSEVIINVSVPEYTKTVLPFVKNARVITPVFLTVKEGDASPRPVVVHAKIARGAYARWIIKNRIEDTAQLPNFNELGYHYNATLSTENQPVYVTKNFQGLGLSVRQNKTVE